MEFFCPALVIGKAYDALGTKDKAQEYYGKSVTNKAVKTEHAYYQGLAHRELGNPKKAEKVFDDLLRFAQKDLKIEPLTLESKNLKIAENHYLAGLAYLGKNMQKKAKNEFIDVLEFNPDHVWAREYLKTLKEN